MGADDHGKQELEAEILARADILVADSISQCVDQSGEEIVGFESFTDKRARNAETLKQPSLCLRWCAPHFYPDYLTLSLSWLYSTN